MSNHFAISQPQNVDCQIMEYHWGRATLLMRLKRQNSPEVQYIRFTGIEYFAGPMEWRGADFDLRPIEECLELLQQANRIADFVTIEDIKERGYGLYVVKLAHTSIGIISKKATRYSA